MEDATFGAFLGWMREDEADKDIVLPSLETSGATLQETTSQLVGDFDEKAPNSFSSTAASGEAGGEEPSWPGRMMWSEKELWTFRQPCFSSRRSL